MLAKVPILKYAGAAVGGALLGYIYWYFVGCKSGSCPITSSPVQSSLYGALMITLIFNSFPSKINK